MEIKACVFDVDHDRRELQDHGTPEFPCAGYETLYTAGPDGDIRWHWHEDLELWHVLEGQMELRVPGRVLTLRAGDCAAVNRNVLHAGDTKSRCRLRSLAFNATLVSGGADTVFARRYLRPLTACAAFDACALGAEERQAFEEAFSALSTGGEGFEFTVRESLSRVCLALFERFAPQKQESASPGLDGERLAIVQMFNDQVVQGQASHFQAALEQQRAEALMESYTAQRRLTHEFTNHIAALDALLRQGDLTGAQEYLSSVSKVVAAGTTILDTHNPLLDSLLSRKYEEAAQQGVELYFDLCDLKDLPFCGTDLVIVISNLLDNAIRAAAQAKPPEVYLRARRNEEEYLISVRNRVQKDLELVDGELPRSTKAEPGHGMGLVNVREVLDRCRCEYTLSCRDRWFRFTCAVPTRKL